MELKKISVIIPVYNIKDYLEKCVDSVLNQTYRNLQIVLVNDGSTDGCGALCDSYQKRDERIIVIHKENGGVSSARNMGVERADGDYITFVDSDDYLEPDMYEQLLKTAEEYQLDVVACGYFITDTPQPLPRTTMVELLHRERAIEHCISDEASSTMCGSVCNKLYRAEPLKQYLAFEPKYIIAEDMLVTIRCLKHADRVGQLNWCGYHYVQRAGSAVHSFKKNKSSSVYAHQEMYEMLAQDYPELAERVRVRSVKQSYRLLLEAISTKTLFAEDIATLRMDLKKNMNDVIKSRQFTGKDRVIIRFVTGMPGMISLLRLVYRVMKR